MFQKLGGGSLSSGVFSFFSGRVVYKYTSCEHVPFGAAGRAFDNSFPFYDTPDIETVGSGRKHDVQILA